MKAVVYDVKGKRKSEVEMPKIFSTKIREDIVKKWVEVDKFMQPYSSDPKAGKKHSASGTISHKRHDWKGHYGRGIARLPRKTMWRRGTQFFWIGAEVSGTRGGRRAHPPKGIGKEKKINKKEAVIAMGSGFAATANEKHVSARYSSLDKLEVKIPIVFESSLDKIKTKELKLALKEIFGEKLMNLILQNKEVRAGKGKRRGRKYKQNAGLLFVKSKDEKIKMNGIEVKNADEIRINDLYPLGRLTAYTEKALKEMRSEDKK